MGVARSVKLLTPPPESDFIYLRKRSFSTTIGVQVMAAKKASIPGGSKRKTTTKATKAAKTMTTKKSSKSKASKTPAKTKPTRLQVQPKAAADLAARKKAAGIKFKKWPDDLFEVYERMHEVHHRVAKIDLVGRYALGDLLNEVLGAPKTYGKRAAIRLAKELPMNLTDLRACGKLAAAWTPQEFAVVIARKDTKGGHLDFSQLTEIAKLSDSAKRDEFVDDVLASPISSRQLSKEISVELKAAKLTGDDETGGDDDEKVDATTLGVRRSIARLGSDIEITPMKVREWDARVLKPLEDNGKLVDADLAIELLKKQEINNEAIKALQAENRQTEKLLKANNRSTLAGLKKAAQAEQPGKLPTHAERINAEITPKLAGQTRLGKAMKATGKTNAELLEGLKPKGRK